MLNQVCIAGNLCQDVELRYTQQGLAIANLNLAVNEHFKDGNGEPRKRTHWFRATAFGRTAEIAGEYLKKGSKVGIAGQLVQRTWQDQEGNSRSSVEIRISQLELMGAVNGNGSSGQTGAPPRTSEGPGSGRQAGRPAPRDEHQGPPPNFGDAYEPPPEQDIPF
jgi:single-strand DNA-binding protein